MSYKVPFVNYPLQYKNLKEEIDSAMERCLQKGDLILRSDVEEFENAVANFLGVKYAIGVSSGADALIFSLKAAGIKPGDEVVTVSHTFVASIASIVHCQAIPILVDVKEDFTMDMDKVEEAITSKTKAIIPVHLNGRSCNMEKLLQIAKRHDLVVIEDSAQALGARYKDSMVGSFGLASCFSFYPAKILGSYGDGGLVTTNDKRIFESVRLLRSHGQKTKTDIVCYGFTGRLDNLQAAILNVKFKYLPGWIERRREIAKAYHKGLRDISQIKLPPSPDSDKNYFDVYQNYVLRVPERDKLAEYLRNNGIEVIISNPTPLHHQKALGLSHFHLPNTEHFAREVISIPNIPELSDDQVKYVIETIHNFYGKSS